MKLRSSTFFLVAFFGVSSVFASIYAADTKTNNAQNDTYKYPPVPPYHIDDTHDTTDVFAIPLDNSEEEDELEMKALNKTAKEEQKLKNSSSK
jgi:hypothetical protein